MRIIFFLNNKVLIVSSLAKVKSDPSIDTDTLSKQKPNRHIKVNGFQFWFDGKAVVPSI